MLILLTFLLNVLGTVQPLNSSELSRRLNNAVESPIFSEPETVFLSSKEIVEIVSPILKQQLASTNYDRIFPILQFLDHYENCQKKGESITPLEAYKNFKFQPLLPGHRGGACVSLSLDIQQSIPSYLKGYIAIAKLPGIFQQIAFPKYAHTAVLIKYQDPTHDADTGYILLDSGFDIDVPIVLRSTGDPIFYRTKKKGVWKFFLEGDKVICEILDVTEQKALGAHESHRMHYCTQHVLNPIEASAIPMMIADRRLSLVSRREDGSQLAHLNIELNKKRVVWAQEKERFSPMSFQEFDENKWAFPRWFSDALYTNSAELTNKVLRIIKNKAILDSLYISYIELLKETQDFSITGEIELEQLNTAISVIQDNQASEPY